MIVLSCGVMKCIDTLIIFMKKGCKKIDLTLILLFALLFLGCNKTNDGENSNDVDLIIQQEDHESLRDQDSSGEISLKETTDWSISDGLKSGKFAESVGAFDFIRDRKTGDHWVNAAVVFLKDSVDKSVARRTTTQKYSISPLRAYYQLETAGGRKTESTVFDLPCLVGRKAIACRT